ncbi:MAG: DUF4145 domain-containing protein [Hyphomicrobium sp.]
MIGEKRKSWQHPEEALWTSDSYRLLECAGCSAIYYQHVHLFSEDTDEGPDRLPIPTTTYFPTPTKRERPDWLFSLYGEIDRDLFDLFNGLYEAVDHDLTVLAASGIRTAFDVAATKLGIDPKLSFAEKVEALKNEGHIGQNEQKNLNIMIEASHAAIHRGFKPKPAELNTMFALLERFFHQSFKLAGEARNLQRIVPPRPSRK